MFPPRPPSPPSGPALGWNLVSYTLQLFQKAHDLRGQKRLWILGFSVTMIKIWRLCTFALDLLGNRSLLQWVWKVMVCDLWLIWWILIRFVCFLVLRFVAFELHEFACFHILALKFFFTFLLNHGKLRFPRWNCSYRASKPRRNTDIGEWKQTGTLRPTLNFEASAPHCRLYLTSNV